MAKQDELVVAGRSYSSRLLVGTGKYKDFAETRSAIEASGAQIVTVAIRRTNIGQTKGEPSLLEFLPPSRFTYLPNTAGCYNAQDAVRTLRLARELLDGHKLVKLEVLGDPHSLYPNMPETLAAAKQLVSEGFEVMVYCSDDPIQAKMLEDLGCVAVMPLASLIGSGMGILNPWNLQLVIERVGVPVLVDAGVGTASDAAIAMELGCDGVLMNTAIAAAKDPVMMAQRDEESGGSGQGGVPRRPHAEEDSTPRRRPPRPPERSRPRSPKLRDPADPQLRPAPGQDFGRPAARAGHALRALRIDLFARPHRRARIVRPRRAARSGNRIRDGRDHRGDRRGAARYGLHRGRGARPRRGQPAEPHRSRRRSAICASSVTTRSKCSST